MDTKIDTRKLSLAALEEKRRFAHQLRKRGMTRAEIGEIVGVHADTVGKWLKLRSNELGYETPGRKIGSGTCLSKEQSDRVRTLIIDKTPDQLKMSYALWTREAVRELIRSKYGIELPVRTVGDYLKRWGMTPQKPQKRAPEVQAWLEEEDPAIQEQSKRESINMISAVTNQGKLRFRIFDGKMNADVLIDFMMRLLKEAKRKVYFILDNLRVHHAKPVKEWLEEHKHMIEVFYLPAYSPELNPDEYLNCDLKAGIHSGVPARNKDQLKQKATKKTIASQKIFSTPKHSLCNMTDAFGHRVNNNRMHSVTA